MTTETYEQPITIVPDSTQVSGRTDYLSELSLETPHRRGSEPYDAALMRLRLRMSNDDGMGYTVGVTSCARGSGVSTFAANMAIRAADLQLGPILLVDAHTKNSSVATFFGAAPTPGLGEVLSGREQIESCIQQSAVHGLDLMTLGGRGLLERASAETERMESLVKELRGEYPLVMFDLPDAQNLMQTLLLTQLIDGVLLVVRAEKTRQTQAVEALRHLRSDGANVIGSVMTHRRNFVPNWVDSRL